MTGKHRRGAPSRRAARPLAPRADFGFRDSSADDLLRARLLAEIDGLDHAFETRTAFLDTAMPRPIGRLHQVHGGEVRRLPAERDAWGRFLEPDPGGRPRGDALITDAVGITVAVSVADCLPILIADPERRAVAAVHGGWRSLAAGIVASTLETLTRELGADPSRCRVAIGPAIGPCCYEVGDEVIAAFAERGLATVAEAPTRSGDGRPLCDLTAVAIAEATRSGVPRTNIVDSGLCTRCHSDRLWSFRADGEAAGRMLAGIGRLR